MVRVTRTTRPAQRERSASAGDPPAVILLGPRIEGLVQHRLRRPRAPLHGPAGPPSPGSARRRPPPPPTSGAPSPGCSGTRPCARRGWPRPRSRSTAGADTTTAVATPRRPLDPDRRRPPSAAARPRGGSGPRCAPPGDVIQARPVAAASATFTSRAPSPACSPGALQTPAWGRAAGTGTAARTPAIGHAVRQTTATPSSHGTAHSPAIAGTDHPRRRPRRRITPPLARSTVTTVASRAPRRRSVGPKTTLRLCSPGGTSSTMNPSEACCSWE